MTEAKRKITKFDFSNQDAHVAIVDKAANAQTVLVMKSAKVQVSLMDFLQGSLYLSETEAEMIAGMMGVTIDNLYDDEEYVEYWKDQIEHNLNRAVLVKSEGGEQINEKLEKFLSKSSQPTLESTSEETVSSSKEDAESVKTDEDNQPVNKEVTQMTQEVNVQELIAKALEAERAELAKAAEEKAEAKYQEIAKAQSQELELLKAAEEARQTQAFIAKAAEFETHLGEGEGKVEALAKALRKMEADEELKAAVDLLKSLKSTVDNADMLSEVGSVSVEKAADDMCEGDKLIAKAVAGGESEPDATARIMAAHPELF